MENGGGRVVLDEAWAERSVGSLWVKSPFGGSIWEMSPKMMFHEKSMISQLVLIMVGDINLF